MAMGTLTQCANFVEVQTGRNRDVIANITDDMHRLINAGIVHTIACSAEHAVNAHFEGLTTQEAFRALMTGTINARQELQRFLASVHPELNLELQTALVILQEARVRMCDVQGKLRALSASPAHAGVMRAVCVIRPYTREQLCRLHADFFTFVQQNRSEEGVRERQV